MDLFIPDRLVVADGALDYAFGRKVYDRIRALGIPVEHLPESGRSQTLRSAKTPKEYQAKKRILVLDLYKKEEFETCKPSADYCLPLAAGCPGMCQYCYLAATFEMKPYTRIYANLEEIFQVAREKMRMKAPETTWFEGAAVADALALEHLGGQVAEAVQFMADQEYGRLRFVTKFDTVDGLVGLPHNGHTKVRFSINSPWVVHAFEQRTAPLEDRIVAARKLVEAGYHVGFIVAPIMHHEGWREGYTEALTALATGLGPFVDAPLTFELIQHRFTPKSKRIILQAYPKTKLPLAEEERVMKPGKFKNAAKYVYPKEQAALFREYIEGEIGRLFPQSTVEYFT